MPVFYGQENKVLVLPAGIEPAHPFSGHWIYCSVHASASANSATGVAVSSFDPPNWGMDSGDLNVFNAGFVKYIIPDLASFGGTLPAAVMSANSFRILTPFPLEIPAQPEMRMEL